jgi:uncharacterized protein (TIGR00730 family)
MRENRASDRPRPPFSVGEEEIDAKIDELLDSLMPYDNLDLLRELYVTGAKLARENCSRGDLKIIRTSTKELRHAFRLFAQYRHAPKVSIFGSARSLPGDDDFETGVRFGRRIAELGYMVVTGAGSGIMAAGNLGAGREMSFGLNILLPFEQLANETIDNDSKLINFRYFFTRKLFFVKESHALVLLPGGFGTQDEGFETLTLIQTGKADPKPVVMLDSPGGSYWQAWREFVVTQMLDKGRISPEDESLYFITDSVEAACREITTYYRRYHSSRYVDRKQRLVIRTKTPLDKATLRVLNQKFADILVEGAIENCDPFPEESDEPELLALPRLVLTFNQRNFGRLRQLIDTINRFG